MIPRVALPEFGDQPWFPPWARDALTGYLQEMIARTQPYAPVVPRLVALIQETHTQRVVDLCSGAGGPWPSLQRTLAAHGASVRVTCTDIAPNRTACASLGPTDPVQYDPTPVSATAVPSTLRGMRTMFSALHHFTPSEVHAILTDAQAAAIPFGAFEATSRSWRGLLATFVIPVAALVLMPLVRPRQMRTIVMTYCLPVLPLAIWWDGLASTLRTYRVEELQRIIASLPTADYTWHVSELRSGALPVLAVFGRPHRQSSIPTREDHA